MKPLLCLLLCCVLVAPALASGPAPDGRFGGHLYFDGVDDHVWMSALVSGQAEGTVELWIYPEPGNTNYQLWGAGNGLPGTQEDYIRIGGHPTAAGLAGGIYSGGWQWADTGVGPAGVWTHVALTWGPQGMTLYENGEFTGFGGYSGPVPSCATELVGSSSWGNFYRGAIDELRIWNVARQPSAIQSTMDDVLGPEITGDAGSGLIAYYRFDALENLGVGGGGADDVRDESLSANHADSEGATLVGCIVLTAADPVVPGVSPLDLTTSPNPFNPRTTLRWSVPADGELELVIVDVRGRRVRDLVRGWHAAGVHEFGWDGRDDGGQFAASGVYQVVLRTGVGQLRQKVTLLK